MSDCGHDWRFHLMGAKNGCCACELEAASERVAELEAEVERMHASLIRCHRYACTEEICRLDGGPEHEAAFAGGEG